MQLPTEENPVTVIEGDCLDVLRQMPDGCVQTCVTSPPYYGLRDYGHEGQIGLEASPAKYVAKMVDVFREVRRVLRDDGTLWLNLGDSYASSTKGSGGTKSLSNGGALRPNGHSQPGGGARPFNHDVKDKDLLGIPWRVAFALQADGWYLRQDIIWHKPNPMPESVRDRCTKAHEYLFLLAKSERYYYDADAVKEPATQPNGDARLTGQRKAGVLQSLQSSTLGTNQGETHRNRRSVWTVTPKPFKGAHFAVMPPELVRPCVRAGSAAGDVVLDPFGGSGTTGLVAVEEGRRAVLCELNPEYAVMARDRIAKVLSVGMFADVM